MMGKRRDVLIIFAMGHDPLSRDLLSTLKLGKTNGDPDKKHQKKRKRDVRVKKGGRKLPGRR